MNCKGKDKVDGPRGVWPSGPGWAQSSAPLPVEEEEQPSVLGPAAVSAPRELLPVEVGNR